MLPSLPRAGNNDKDNKDDKNDKDFAVQRKEFFMIKKILCVLMVFALVVSLGACKKDNSNIPTGGNSTTTQGQSEESTTGMSATEIVTNEKGEPVTNDKGETIVVDSTQEVSLISDETMPAGTKVEVTTTANGKPVKPLVDSSLGDTLKGKKYSIKFTAQIDMDGSRQTMPAAIYVSGKKSLVELSMGGTGLGLGPGLAKMSVLNNEKGNYLLISILGVLKGYVPIPADQAGEYDMIFDFSGISDTSDMKYIKTTKVTYKGVEYICEEYRSTDSTVKFYFNQGKLKRIEQVGDDGSKVFMENIEISAKFDEKVFNIPVGYKEITEKDLENLTGLFG